MISVPARIPLRNRIKMKIAQGVRDLDLKALKAVLSQVEAYQNLGLVIKPKKKRKR